MIDKIIAVFRKNYENFNENPPSLPYSLPRLVDRIQNVQKTRTLSKHRKHYRVIRESLEKPDVFGDNNGRYYYRLRTTTRRWKRIYYDYKYTDNGENIFGLRRPGRWNNLTRCRRCCVGRWRPANRDVWASYRDRGEITR